MDNSKTICPLIFRCGEHKKGENAGYQNFPLHPEWLLSRDFNPLPQNATF